MTRITNFGRKRKYLEAGFGTAAEEASKPSPQPEASTSTAVGVVNEETAPKADDAVAGEGGEPPKKKRKRHRSKKKKTDQEKEGETGNENGEPSEGGKEGGEDAKDSTAKSKKAKKNPKNKKKKEYVSPSEKRRLARIKERLANTTCFVCREKGHAARDCPRASELAAAAGEPPAEGKKPAASSVVGICYRCGSTKHNLSKCKKPPNPENPLPYASCFVCSGKGHLASACPQNKTKGVYPNGGCCKICGDTSHLAKDCTIRRNDPSAKATVGTGRDVGADEDDFMALTRKSKQVEREEQKEERFKRLLEVSEHAPTRVVNGVPKTTANPLAPKPAKKVVVF
ncbi:zinc knuckle family protein [Coprinopsis cinerea okayama7|uniref:Zinc knuckle family protein n=1 Tax=Coprinopsis cinerea (strain Okayama-7 / 130 / ATCC MYA-4618 / FGSC 9003) TaxID=240176 RepID=A8N7L2_COPC7|nr:zinc knuckle family protein [Coprinopsis cinerea okayama7\|eukprot:XP_001830818.1 zinc knuckle family protein [Coprinopsis cinerea okayama7\